MSDKLDDLLLLEKLAAGGMAEVYRAVHQGYGGFEKIVAVKRILPHFASDEEFKNMFTMEANLSGLFMHPNIVQIYSNGEAEGYLYLVMEFVDGRNVRQLLARCDKAKTRIPIEYSSYMIAEAAKGLDYAHSFVDQKTGQDMEIVHRDMSPQNIMLSYDGSVKIVDFGIAKAAARSEHTRAGVLKGKFGYMSPEQSNGMPIDRRTDIFALGIIFFELLTQRRLFSHDDDMRTLQLIRECNVPRPSKYNPTVSPALDRIVLKALAKNRNERYQTAGEFYADLQRFINQKYPNFLPMEFAKFLKEKAFTDDIAKDKAKREALAADAPARLGSPQASKRKLQGAPNKEAPKDKDSTQVGFDDDDSEATVVSEIRDMAGVMDEVVIHMEEEEQAPPVLEAQEEAKKKASTRITESDAEGESSLPEPKMELTSSDEEEVVLDPPKQVDANLKSEIMANELKVSLDTVKEEEVPKVSTAFPTQNGPSHLSLSMTMNDGHIRAIDPKAPQATIKAKPKAPLKRAPQRQASAKLDLEAPSGHEESAVRGSYARGPEIRPVDSDSAKSFFMNPMFLLVMALAGVGAYFNMKSDKSPTTIADSTPPAASSGNTADPVKVTKAKEPPKSNPADADRQPAGNQPMTFDAPIYEAKGATGYLNIVSFPSATQIYVDGKILVEEGEAVRSPANLQKVEVGPRRLRLVNKALGMSWEGQVEVGFDSVKKVEVRMQ
ncbi:protein kinase [bacterium]|nr:protein kinase [bacterium]